MSCDCLAQVSTCQNHSIAEHLFVTPFCEDEALLVKILTVFFHVLTLGVPLLVYNVVVCCFPEMAIAPNIDHEAIAAAMLQSIQNAKIINANDALRFANAELEAYPQTAPFKWPGKYQPLNPAIAVLETLFREKYLPDFEASLKIPNTLWSNHSARTFAAGATYINIAFAISYLTLEETPAFQAHLAAKGIVRTPEQTLTSEDSYQSATFSRVGLAYRTLRGGLAYNPDTRQLEYPVTLPADYVSLFYDRPGTWQNLSRGTYNYFCHAVTERVNRAALGHEAPLFIALTAPDKKPDDFIYQPNIIPA